MRVNNQIHNSSYNSLLKYFTNLKTQIGKYFFLALNYFWKTFRSLFLFKPSMHLTTEINYVI